MHSIVIYILNLSIHYHAIVCVLVTFPSPFSLRLQGPDGLISVQAQQQRLHQREIQPKS